MTKRFWEIDFVRGIAVILMVLFNYAFALNFFGIISLLRGSWVFWFMFPRIIGAIFIFLAGMSLVISYNRAKNKHRGKRLFGKYLARGLKIFALGIVITLATYIFFPRLAVVFGILHLIGAMIILSFPFIERKVATLVLGIIIIATGALFSLLAADSPWLVWAGISPQNFQTLDYFPLAPWWGVGLIGIFFGNVLYRKNRRSFSIADRQKAFAISHLGLLGRHSLLVYFLHIPALILLLHSAGFGIFL